MKNIDKYRIKNKLNKNNKKGFTLIELVVVIAVIAILSGVSVGAYFGIQKEAKEKALLAEATDSYNQYRIDQILNNEELNDSSKIDGIYYSENYDEYILFKDDTTYNLGKYIEETNEFTNSNRFAIDYDNDGLPVVIDLDNSVEGIESKVFENQYYVTLVDDYVGNGFRLATFDNVSIYQIFSTLSGVKYGKIANYSPFFILNLIQKIGQKLVLMIHLHILCLPNTIMIWNTCTIHIMIVVIRLIMIILILFLFLMKQLYTIKN